MKRTIADHGRRLLALGAAIGLAALPPGCDDAEEPLATLDAGAEDAVSPPPDTSPPAADARPVDEGSAPDAEVDAQAPAAPTITVLTVDLDAADHPTGDLIGWNIGRGTLYAPADDPLHPEWRTPGRIEAAARLGTIRPAHGRAPLVRFSGLQIDGALGGDGYHIGPLVDPERVADPDDNMAPWQYMALIDEMGGEPVVTVNFGSGTAAEAAAYTRHLTGVDPADPLVAARQRWGRVEPWAQRWFEIGNEVYAWWNTGFSTTSPFAYANAEAVWGGDPDWIDQPSSDPAAFAGRALEYVEAVLAVAPEARFFIPLSQAPMDAWGGLEAALSALAPLLAHPAVESVVIHHYQVDDLATIGLVGGDDPAYIVAGTTWFAEGYDRLHAMLAALDRERPLSLAITEYHVAGAFARGSFSRGEEAIVGLGIADLLIDFARRGVAYALQHMALNFQSADDPERDRLLEAWYVPYRPGANPEDPLIEMPSARVTRLFAEQLLPQTVVPTAQREVLMSHPRRDLSYAAVRAVAFTDGDTARLMALNRDLDAPQPLALALPAGWRAQGGETWAPPDASQDARESPTDPSPLSADAIIDGTPEAYTAEVDGTDGITQTIMLPPGSVTALELIRAE